jgi:Chaperone of endosialidase
MKQHLLLLFLAVMAGFVVAQNTPQGINYQCIIRNNQTGNPIINQTVTLLFSIRNGSPTGPVDYQEKHIGSTNEFGLANLVIGRGQPQVNTFAGINWGAGSKFLTVLLETTPNVFDEIGNSELLSVPYALYAQNGGSGGNDNWGNQTAFTNNSISGNGLANNPIGLAQQGAQAGQILKWNGSAWIPADDLLGTGIGGGTVTQVNTGTGLQGGPVTSSGTISLTNTGVQVGTHGSPTEIPVITVDAQGRITNIEKVNVQPGPVAVNSGNGINVVTNGFNIFTIDNSGDTDPNDDLTLSTVHDGDITGPFNNLQLNANVVTSNELNNGSVTAPKLADMGAASGQVLKWNGIVWAPAADDAGTVSITSGAGISVTGSSPNFTITNSGDTNATDDLTTATQANGDVSGPFNNLQIKANAVTNLKIADNAVESSKILDGAVNTAKIAANAVITNKIADAAVTTAKIVNDAVTTAKILDGAVTSIDIANQAVTGDKIDDMGAANGQVLKWNGTIWAPATDASGNFNVLPGAGMDVTQSGNTFIVVNAGDIDASDDLTTATVFNGDVTGASNNLQLKAGIVTNSDMAPNSIGTSNLINGTVTAAKLNNMNALTGQILQFNGVAWAPSNLPAASGDNWGTQITQTNGTLSGGGITGNLLGIAQQGATNGQILRWNGTSWVPGTITVGAGLNGNGNPATPLNLAQQGAAINQVLQWNGIAWVPATLPPVVGDNWGAQTAQVGAALSGNGTLATPINLAQQGAAINQVLQWNGMAWVPGTLPPVVGDNWGAQTAQVGNALAGNGTVATPLNLNQQGAVAGEVLKWNGASWLPAADNSGGTGDNYSAGPGISVTGVSPNFTINNIGDADNNPANELQTISIVGNQLTLSNGGGTVILPGGSNYAEGTGIDITGVAPNFTINNVGDLSNTNELQNLTLTGPILGISNGNTVDLTSILSGGNNWNNLGDHIFNANTGNVLIGTNVNGTGKLQVVNGNAANEAGRFMQTAGNTAAVLGQANAGPGGSFSSNTGPALITGTGNVGIGTAAPVARLHVLGNGESVRLQGNTPSISFVPNGAGAVAPGYARMTNMLAIGTQDVSNVALMPNGNTAVVANGFNGYVGIGEFNGTDASLRVAQKQGGILLNNQNNGNFWEFSASPIDGSLQLFNSTLGGGFPAGTFTAAGLYVPSDRRLKTDIEAISSGVLTKLMKLNPVSYRYIAEDPNAKHSIGFLAQDVQAVFPELVAQSIDHNGKKGYLSINYGGFGVLAVKAIQEQQTEIEALTKENLALRNKTESLEARLLRLEKLAAEK